jgi:hypothetical protein
LLSGKDVNAKKCESKNEVFKKTLYEQLGVREYWLFDPKEEWIEEQLRGYRLQKEEYEPIRDDRSDVLKLQLRVKGQLIGFYREDTGEKLLIPGELAQALERERQRTEKLAAKLRELGVDPDRLE